MPGPTHNEQCGVSSLSARLATHSASSFPRIKTMSSAPVGETRNPLSINLTLFLRNPIDEQCGVSSLSARLATHSRSISLSSFEIQSMSSAVSQASVRCLKPVGETRNPLSINLTLFLRNPIDEQCGVSSLSARLATHSRSISFFSSIFSVVQTIHLQDRDSRRELSRSDCHPFLRGSVPISLLEQWLRLFQNASEYHSGGNNLVAIHSFKSPMPTILQSKVPVSYTMHFLELVLP
ncbi:hypothetical protein BLNAU_6779 [Blattamonas nauphoetae]|uniref:Uncharacterized protein n=1 Tax=Blattamonas nauphoetae TaxID=2049346 RepID=A0ABQ9Y3H1_9EUKA|nr:hypothetical protein BLNAU_6779 [Blattamonas nauphoetae]